MATGTAGEQLPTVDLRTTSESAQASEQLPQGVPSVPGHEILSVLGRGGMGIVYKAWHLNLKRAVALKMIGTNDVSSSQLRRFRTEVEAVARLQHPNIVQIHDAGEADGRPFFSMEYLEGGTLSPLFKKQPQRIRQSAQLVQILAEATHYAHQNNVVHRDLKPANVLLMQAPSSRGSGDTHHRAEATRGTDTSGGSDSSNSQTIDLAYVTPKISDFGLAKQLGDDSGQTHTGEIIGTPNYMAPEQASATWGKIGPATDVYALGAILYCALTSRPPFEGENKLETMEQVCTKEPVPPSRLRRRVPADLETICLKCLQKDPGNRYHTAKELAEDLGRFLDNEPIRARPVSPAARAWRWCRRNPGLATAISLAVFFLLAGSGASLFLGVQSQKNERQATMNAKEAVANQKKAEAANRLGEQRRYGLEMLLAYEAWESGQIGLVNQWLKAQMPKEGSEDLRGFEWSYVNQLCHLDLRTLHGHAGFLFSVTFSPDGKLLASAGEDNQIIIWESATGREVRSLRDEAPRVASLAFSPDGRYLASAGWDNLIKLWEVDTGKKVRTFEGHVSRVNAVAFSPDGKHIASGGSDRSVRIWDVASGKEVHYLQGDEGAIHGISFSRHGHRLAAIASHGTIQVWDTASWKQIGQAGGDCPPPGCITLSPDGRFLAASYKDHQVRVWDVATMQPHQVLRGHTAPVTSLVFSRDGARIVSTSGDGTARTWDVGTGQQSLIIRGHDGSVHAAALSPDGRRLATVGNDRLVKIWDSTSPQEALSLRGHTAHAKIGKQFQTPVTRVRYSPDGQWLASASEDNTVKIWNAASGQEKMTLKGHTSAVRSVAFSPNSVLLASGSDDGAVRIWDLKSGNAQQTLTGNSKGVLSLAFGADGSSVYCVGDDSAVTIWNVAQGQKPRILAGQDSGVFAAAFSRDIQRFATAGEHGVVIRDTATGALVQTCSDGQPAISVCFSPDGERVVVGYAVPRKLNVWSVTSGEIVAELPGHTCAVSGVEFSADGTRIVSASGCDFSARIWDAVTGQELIALPCPAGVPHAVLSPDGMQLAGASGDGTIKIWDARPMSPEREVQREARSVVSYLFEQHVLAEDALLHIRNDATITEPVRKEALELVGPYGRSLIECDAHRIVEARLEKPLTREEAIKSIRNDSTIWEPVRQRALAMAREYPENATALFGAIQATVLTAGAEARHYTQALDRARAYRRLKPDDPDGWRFLGMAMYRVGQYKEALAALDHYDEIHGSDRLSAPDRAFVAAQQLAFQAMAQHRLGLADSARKTLERLSEAMKLPMKRVADAIAAGLFREAQEVLGQPAGQSSKQE